MTLLGKIFTMLIFVMSLVFMTLSLMVFATHRNWKQTVLNPTPTGSMPLGLKLQVENAQDANEQIKEQMEAIQTELERERAARRMAIQHLHSKAALLQNDLEQAETQLQDHRTQNAELLKQLEIAQAEMASKTEEVNTLRAEVQTARADRDKQFDEVVALTDQLHQHQAKLETLGERRDQLALQITDMKRVMDHFGLTVDTPLHNRPPRVDGIVTEVSTQNNNFIEISLGSDDGLRTGHELVVFRDKSYLARVVIRKVDSNAAVAEIVRETRRGTIRKGDSVTTRFS